jgi:hypothetical protein
LVLSFNIGVYLWKSWANKTMVNSFLMFFFFLIIDEKFCHLHLLKDFFEKNMLLLFLLTKKNIHGLP